MTDPSAPAFGVLSTMMRDNLYWFGPRGFIFTSPWVVTPSTARPSAVLLLTAGGQPVEVTVGDQVVTHDTMVIAPLTQRGLRAMDAGLVSVHVFPPHPSFRAFQGIPAPGVLPLSRKPLECFSGSIAQAYEGRLTLPEAQRLFDDVVDLAVEQLPRRGPPRSRGDRLHELLQARPACSLEEVARELRLSYSGTSRHFARAVGLPLRSYRLWLKYYTAADLHLRGSSWTEAAYAAGFSDSSHLVRTWQTSFGFSPSYTNDSRHVRIFTSTRSDAAAAPGSGPHDQPLRGQRARPCEP